MKDLLLAAGVIALGFGLVAAAVFGLDDTDTFVSPPEIVAEEFVRAVGTGRVEPARSMLASKEERDTSIREVRGVSRTFRSRVGHPLEVKGTIAEPGRDTSIVRVEVKGERKSSELTLPLVRERGVWSIAMAGDELRNLVNAQVGEQARP